MFFEILLTLRNSLNQHGKYIFEFLWTHYCPATLLVDHGTYHECLSPAILFVIVKNFIVRNASSNNL